jgi:hypothetical protein
MRAEASFDHEIDPSANEGFELFGERQIVTPTSIRRHVDEQVNVAIGPFLAANDGAEEAHVRGAVPRGDGGERSALANKVFTKQHDDVERSSESLPILTHIRDDPQRTPRNGAR